MKEKISMIIFIIILGTILTTALVAVDNYTSPIIARNEDIKQKKSVLKAFNILFQEDGIEQAFHDKVKVLGDGNRSFYVSQEGAVAFLFRGSGLWGPIEGILSMDRNIKTINSIEIMHQEETPGLGSRIAEKTYLEKFKNKIFSPHLKMVPEGQSRQSNEIDGLTGATMSCKAFIAILNEQYELFKPIISGDEDGRRRCNQK